MKKQLFNGYVVAPLDNFIVLLLSAIGISGLARYASQQGYSISTYLIKKAIKDGQLPCRIVGKAYLITWENFEEWISCRSCPPELKGGMACANHRSKKE